MESVTLNHVTPHPEWKRLFDATVGLDYGTFISHQNAAEILGLVYKTKRYYQQVTQWQRAMLREHHRAVRVIPDKGYEIIKPDDYTAHSRNRFIQGRRRLKDAARIAIVAPTDKMSSVQSTKHANHLAWVGPIVKILNKIERNTRPALLEQKRPDLPKLKE